jgi:hypothetical protein
MIERILNHLLSKREKGSDLMMPRDSPPLKVSQKYLMLIS